MSERDKALLDALQAVDRAVTPLGHSATATDSPWNKGLKHAKVLAMDAIKALREEQRE